MGHILAFSREEPPRSVFRRSLIHRLSGLAAEVAGVPVSSVLSADRHARPTFARLAVYMVARESGKSFGRIGLTMNRDHSSVLTGCRRAIELEKADEDFARLVRLLRLEAAS